MKITTFIAAAGLLCVAAPAVAAPTCLRNLDIYSFDAPNSRTLIVETTSHTKFKVSLLGSCQSLPFKQTLGFRTVGGTSLSCISSGDQIISRDFGQPQVCSVANVVPYTPEMEAADKAAKAAKDAAH